MSQGFLHVLLIIPVFLFSLCLHELAHAFAAWRLGDPTARLAGRLTLHPMAHADMVGTLLLPTICVFSGLPFIGWAKPVPVDVRYFRHPRFYMALVAAAGPASNIALACLSTGLLWALVRTPPFEIGAFNLSAPAQLLLLVSIQANLMLALLNLIPVPPLDGFNILQFFLPKRLAAQAYRLGPALGMALLVLMLTGGLRYLSRPAQWLFAQLISLVG